MNSTINSNPINESEKKPVMQRLARFFDGGGSAVARSPESETLSRLRALSEERGRVRSLVAAEEKRAEALSEQLRKKDAERIDSLTEARLSGADADSPQLETSQADLAALRRGIEEAAAVAGRLRARLSDVEAALKKSKYDYERELTALLDNLYEQAMGRYNDLAPAVAQAILEVAAIRRVMMSLRLGNTNGWTGEVLLPGMEPRQGALVPPVLQGSSREFADRADKLAQAANERVRAAGFVYNLK